MGRKEQEKRIYDQPDALDYGTASLMDKGYTPAQKRMREDMLPPTVAEVLDEGLRPASLAQPDVSQTALDIIHSGENLQLSLREWHIVQGMIEAGVRAGRATAR